MHMWVYTHKCTYVCMHICIRGSRLLQVLQRLFIWVTRLWGVHVIFVCMHTSANKHTQTCMHTYIICTPIGVLSHMWEYTYIFLYSYIHICESMHIDICICIYVHVYKCKYVCTCASIHISVHLYACIYIYIYMAAARCK